MHRFVNSQPRVREQLTKIIYGSKDADIELFQHKIRVNALLENGYYRAWRLARNSSTLRHESAILQRLALFIENGMTFVDIGANVGLFSINLSDVRNIYADFKIVAFEANPDTAKRLKVNADRYGFDMINSPLASEEREIDFVSGAVSGVTTTVSLANAYNLSTRRFTATTRRLDSFTLEGNLFLKIDVEGQELDVLRGATGLFDSNRIRAVYIDGFGRDPAVPSFLADRGFTLYEPFRLTPFNAEDYMLLAVKH